MLFKYFGVEILETLFLLFVMIKGPYRCHAAIKGLVLENLKRGVTSFA